MSSIHLLLIGITGYSLYMFALLLSIPQIESQKPKVAFIARFYGAPGSSKKSKPAIYVCDWDGTHRQLVSSPSKEPYAILWSGTDRLVWLCDSGESSEIWTAAWPKGIPKLLGTKKITSFWKSHPSTPALSTGDDSEWYTVTGKGSLQAMGAINDPFPGIAEMQGPAQFGKLISEDTAAFTHVDQTGKSSNIEFEPGYYEHRYVPATQDVFLRTMQHDSTLGNHFTLCHFNWHSKKFETIIEDYAQASFWPTRTTIAYCWPRDLQAYGKKQVWTSPLVVGDWKTRKFKKIVSGLVYVTSTAIRPQ